MRLMKSNFAETWHIGQRSSTWVQWVAFAWILISWSVAHGGSTVDTLHLSSQGTLLEADKSLGNDHYVMSS